MRTCVTYEFVCLRDHGYIILITVLGVGAGGGAMHRGRPGGHGEPGGTEQHHTHTLFNIPSVHTHTHTNSSSACRVPCRLKMTKSSFLRHDYFDML